MADLAHRAEGDTDLHGDPDAAHWAERFVMVRSLRQHQDGTDLAASADTMLAWFASAIETGRAAGRAEARTELLAEMLEALGGLDPVQAGRQMRPGPVARILPEFTRVDEHAMQEAIGLALGAASACWDNLAGAGVFDSEAASQVCGELMAVAERFRAGE